MLDLFLKIKKIQGNELCLDDFMKYAFNIGLCEPISFKLGVIWDRANLLHLIPVWMSMTFTQGHRITEC